MSAIDATLCRQLIESADRRSIALTATCLRQRAWASALFVGRRLTIELGAEETDAFDAWLAALPEEDLPLRTHFVASAEVIQRRAGAAVVELLVVEG